MYLRVNEKEFDFLANELKRLNVFSGNPALQVDALSEIILALREEQERLQRELKRNNYSS
jgi:uncharacterized small protein (DUF1192 family)